MFQIKFDWGFAAFMLLLFLSNASGSCHSTLSRFYIRTFSCSEYAQPIASLLVSPLFKLEMNNVTNVQPAVDDLKSFLDKNRLYSVYKVIINNSNVTVIPNNLFILNGLNEVQLYGNNIKSINFNVLRNAKNLTALDLSNNRVKEIVKDDTTYASTRYLELINLSHNQLDRIPIDSFVSTRDSLKYLYLSNNEITNIDPNAFSNLASLKVLHLSHNKLANLTVFFYPVQNLENLYLDHNRIQNINTIVFNKSTRLVTLDLSFNSIEVINDRAFSALRNLKVLNLSYNKIKFVKGIVLKNNIHLNTLSLSHNNISNIEPDTFSPLKNLQHIYLESALTTNLETKLLRGLKSAELNLAGCKISKIEETPFVSMQNSLKSLNLSSCDVKYISQTALDSLVVLNQLDLSNNKLTKIDFLKVELENLSKLYLQNNSISELKPDSFQRLLALTELHLSNNNIQTIPAKVFKNLKNLKVLKILNNKLNNILLSNTFFGLDNVQHLKLMNTKFVRWDSYALTGLKNLKFVNASHGELAYIDPNAFTGTSNIQVLDLSYNKLENFNIKLLHNNSLREIYLCNNKLRSVLRNSFEGFSVLEILNLSNNKLVTVESLAFSSLRALKHLDLSINPNIKLADNVFTDLVLNTLFFNTVNNKINFDKSEKSTIKNLDISSNQISNISLLYLQNINNLTSLDLSNNNIAIINEFSLGNNIISLKSLNLSRNRINHINQGAFLNKNLINNLDLSYNNIDRIRFGALRGLRKLKTINLSNNVISKFKLAVLYDVPSVSTIILDGNKIDSLVWANNLYRLRKLSIGDNIVLCDELIPLLSHPVVIVTTRILDYGSENIDGIACYS